MEIANIVRHLAYLSVNQPCKITTELKASKGRNERRTEEYILPSISSLALSLLSIAVNVFEIALNVYLSDISRDYNKILNIYLKSIIELRNL